MWLSALNLTEKKYPKNKIYLSRTHQPLHRSVLNNTEVEEYLKNKGFYIWRGDMDFEERVHMFRDADVIVGPHGGAFFNCLFCKNDPLVLEFTPKSRAIGMWRDQSHILGNTNHRLIIKESDTNHNHAIDIQSITI